MRINSKLLYKIGKKIRVFFLLLSLCFNLFSVSFASIKIPGEDPNNAYNILTKQEDTIVTVGENTWREGAHDAIHADNGGHVVGNLINSDEKITTQADAHQRILTTLWRIINFALGFLSLISFVILIIAGIRMLVGAGDDKAQGAGKAAILKVVKAIVGIAISWFIINMIFWIIDNVFF